MKRVLVLGVLLSIGMLSMSVAAYQQAPAPRVVEVEKIRDNFYVMRGGGGNSGVFITADGVVVVDTKNPGWGAPLLEKIRSVTVKPITMIINTHTHGDHVSGNVEFPSEVEVVVHENTAKNMKEMRVPTGITPAADAPANIFRGSNGKGLPKRVYRDRLTLGGGNDRIELYYLGRGHTDGDSFVVFPALRVMHAGDIFSGKNIPLLDAVNGGSGVAIGDTLAKAAGIANIESIITGHSTVMTVADLKEYAQFNNDFRNAVQAGKKAGKTVEAIAKEWKLPEKYKGYADPNAQPAQQARLLNNVRIVFEETK